MSVYRPTRARAIAGGSDRVDRHWRERSARERRRPAGSSATCASPSATSPCARYDDRRRARRAKRLRTIRANDPVDVCASGDRVLLATSCAGTALTLPPSSDPVNFCARSGSFLRYVTVSTDCGRRELAFVVSSPDPPVIALTGSALATYTEGDDATAVDPNLTVTDPAQHEPFALAVARVSDGLPGGKNVSGHPRNPSGPSHCLYHPTTAVLTLLRHRHRRDVSSWRCARCTFAHTGDTPSTSRTIGLTATDVGGTTSTEKISVDSFSRCFHARSHSPS